MSDKAMEMDDETKPQKQKREKKIRKQKKDRETKFDWSKVWNAVRVGFIVFLKVIWKFIKLLPSNLSAIFIFIQRDIFIMNKRHITFNIFFGFVINLFINTEIKTLKI